MFEKLSLVLLNYFNLLFYILLFMDVNLSLNASLKESSVRNFA